MPTALMDRTTDLAGSDALLDAFAEKDHTIAQLNERIAALEGSLKAAHTEETILRNDNTVLGLKLMDAREKQSEIQHANELLVSEMNDLTEKLFQEANILVSSESRRRHEAEVSRTKMAQELQQANIMLKSETDQLKALRDRLEQGPRSHTPSDNASILTNNTVEVVPPNSIDNGELPQPDPRIYGEFVLFLQQLSQSKSLVKSIGLTFMRRCIQEDVEPAMFMLKKANVMRTIEAMMENRLFIEATESTVFVGPNSSSDMIHESCCSACDHPMMTLPYRYRLEESAPWKSIDNRCREILVAVSEIFAFFRYLKLGLFNGHPTLEVYYELARLRRKLFYVRIGFNLPDTSVSSPSQSKLLTFMNPQTQVEALLQQPTTLLTEARKAQGGIEIISPSSDPVQRDWTKNVNSFRQAMASFMRRPNPQIEGASSSPARGRPASRSPSTMNVISSSRVRSPSSDGHVRTPTSADNKTFTAVSSSTESSLNL